MAIMVAIASSQTLLDNKNIDISSIDALNNDFYVAFTLAAIVAAIAAIVAFVVIRKPNTSSERNKKEEEEEEEEVTAELHQANNINSRNIKNNGLGCYYYC